MKTAKLASAHFLDSLPTAGSPAGNGFRDHEFERQILEATQQLGIGAQFGGKYFCHDVRVVRLPRHGGSLPIALAVSCAADRHVLGKITSEGVFLEQLETDPAQFLPDVDDRTLDADVVRIDLNQSLTHTREQLSAHPVGTRVSLTGTLVVARDLAHAKIRDRLKAGEPLPDYLRRYPVFYAGPAKRPDGYATGSLGPDDRGPDGFLRQGLPGRRWFAGDAGERQPLRGGAALMPRTRRVLPGIRSADRRPGSHTTASNRLKCSNTANSAWKRYCESRSRTSRPSSSSTTKATTSTARTIRPC